MLVKLIVESVCNILTVPLSSACVAVAVCPCVCGCMFRASLPNCCWSVLQLICYYHGGHSPGKPGKVREFKIGQGKVRDNRKSWGKCVLRAQNLPIWFSEKSLKLLPTDVRF